jgi:type IV secretory pathway TraG/TraD family ATPase VirD4
MSHVQRVKNGAIHYEPTLFFGGIEQGWHVSPMHFSIIGETGSGKTATMRMLMKSVLGRVGQGVRVVVFDPKCQFVPIVGGLAPGAAIDIAHIGDARTVGWDMQRDCRTEKACRSIAHVLLPVNPNNKDPFFATASRTLLTAVLRSFVASKVDWTFRDALHAMLDVDVLRRVLERTAQGRRIVKLYFGVRPTLLNVLSTVANDLDPYLEVAAAWDNAMHKLAIRDWVKGDEDRILVLGHDDENEPTSKCVNQVLFERLKQSLLTPPFEGRETWLFLDEITLAGFPPKALLRLADLGRELGVRLVLAAQGLDGCVEHFGERLTFQLFGNCINQAMLRTSSNRTADFFSRQVGKYETIEIQNNTSYGPGGTSRSENEQKVVRDAVMPSEFQTLPVASRRWGFEGIYVGELGTWRAHLNPADIQAHIGQADESIPAFVAHASEPLLRPWDEADVERLQLPLEVLDAAEVGESDDAKDDEVVEPQNGEPRTEETEAPKGTVWTKLKHLVGKKAEAPKSAPDPKKTFAKRNLGRQKEE